MTKKHPALEKIKEILRKKLPQALSEKVLEFNTEYKTLGSKPEEEKRHEEEKKMFQAVSKGLPAESDKPEAAQTATSAVTLPPAKEEDKKVPAAEGSAWNAKAYHWEEKAVSEWATKRVKELFTSAVFEIGGMKGSVSEIKAFAGDVYC